MSQEALSFIRSLSPEQRDAAMSFEEPTMIIAGAGSGKTRTLVARLLHLILPESAGGKGADPSSIMMVTFTNKAAREMNERVKSALEELRSSGAIRGGDPWIGTFHGLSLRILRIEAARAGLGKGFSIFDDSDAHALVKDLIETMGIAQFDIDDFFRDLEVAKARLLGADLLALKQVQIDAALDSDRALDPVLLRWKKVIDHFNTPDFIKIYSAYQNALKDQNAVDFSDLMNRVTQLFQEHPDIRDSWRSSFRHFMVDEVQDINRAQVAWLHAMTAGGKVMEVPEGAYDNDYANASDGLHEINTYRLRKFPRPSIAFVGDDDQSIYGFRGSEVAVMRSLEKRFPGLVVRFLQESYRCQPSILSVANTVITNNTERFGKELQPADRSRARQALRIEKHRGPLDEIQAIAVKAREHIKAGGNASEFAVLVRTRDLARAVARDLRAAGLPVSEGKASDIRKSAEVRDIMSFAGYIVNPEAETLLRRIINKPARGMGMTSIAVVGSNARLKNISFIEELRSIVRNKVDLPPEATPYKAAFTRSCRDFGEMIVDLRSRVSAAADGGAALLEIMERTGYLADLKRDALQASSLDRTPEVMALPPREFLSWMIENSAKDAPRSAPRAPIADGISDAGREAMEHEDLADRAGQISEKARRIGNLSVLIAQAAHFETLDAFMQEAMLEMDQAEAVAGIQVMTIHGSKGLEFDHVHLPFWIEGVMPHSRASSDPLELEEERRLAYVAITRAREAVTVSHSWDVRNCPFIRVSRSQESTFIREICNAPSRDIARFNVDRPGYARQIPAGRPASTPAPAASARDTRNSADGMRAFMERNGEKKGEPTWMEPGTGGIAGAGVGHSFRSKPVPASENALDDVPF